MDRMQAILARTAHYRAVLHGANEREWLLEQIRMSEGRLEAKLEREISVTVRRLRWRVLELERSLARMRRRGRGRD